MGDMMRWLMLLGIAMSGCAFALSGPEGTPPHTYPRCDNGKGRVVADALVAAGLGVTALATAGGNSSAAVVPALGAAVFVASAVRGNTIANDCRKAQESFIAQVTPLPAPQPDQPEERQAITSPVPLAPVAEPAVAPKPRQRPAPPPPPPPSDDPWSAFWKVAP